MSRRKWSAAALLVGLTSALALIALGAFLSAQDLNRAAAWANIVALFVAVFGVAVSVLGVWRPPSTHSSTAGGTNRDDAVLPIKQKGRARGNVINVAGSNNTITTNDSRRR